MNNSNRQIRQAPGVQSHNSQHSYTISRSNQAATGSGLVVSDEVCLNEQSNNGNNDHLMLIQQDESHSQAKLSTVLNNKLNYGDTATESSLEREEQRGDTEMRDYEKGSHGQASTTFNNSVVTTRMTRLDKHNQQLNPGSI